MLKERDAKDTDEVKRGRLHRRSAARVAQTRRRLAPRASSLGGDTAFGRVWLNGRELGSPDGRFAHLGASYD